MGLGPLTALHYAAATNLSATDVYDPASAGFNLADVSSVATLNVLPAGVLGLVYLGLTSGADATFISTVTPFIGNPKLWGFYIADEPIAGQVDPANIKAESDWIHANVPGAKTFIVLENEGTPNAPSYAFNQTNTGCDLFGLDPYPVRAQFSGGIDLTVIGAAVSAATSSGIPLDTIVPVYQTFGGGGYPSWTLPTPDQLRSILSTWAGLVPTPAFDYAYSWGTQSGDDALVTSPALRAVMLAHNSPGITSMQLDSTTRTSMASQIVSAVANGTCKLFTGGVPANTAASDPAGDCASGSLGATPLQAIAASGQVTINGTWTLTGENLGGVAASFRLYDNTAACRLQGTVGWQTSAAWTASHAYSSQGFIVSNGSGAYQVATTGTSASSGGPTGTGSGITDGTVTWNYLGPVGDLNINNTNVANGQTITVSQFTMPIGNA